MPMTLKLMTPICEKAMGDYVDLQSVFLTMQD